MIFEEIKKRHRLSKDDFIKYQLIVYCFLNKINFSDAEINCLVILSKKGKCYLTDLCSEVYNLDIFKSTQTVRNCIGKAIKNELVLIGGKTKKIIVLNPKLNIKCEGNVLLDYKFILDESIESKRLTQ